MCRGSSERSCAYYAKVGALGDTYWARGGTAAPGWFCYRRSGCVYSASGGGRGGCW